jgi:acyl CoA:acetate/3-ketoacid CoA transferase alpha subunit/acyl CoA:acetate/3-ketoacid CoA transferase beta subunit
VRPLDEAVRDLVEPGMHLHLAYGGGRPNATIAQLVRRFAGTSPRFTVSAHGFVSTQHVLVSEGLVEKLIVAFAGENYPSPRPNKALQRALAGREVSIENWSIGTLTARLMAAALGVDFMPVRALSGSSMAREHDPGDFREISGFGSSPQPVVRALRPDLTLVHGLMADSHGNVLLAAPYGEGTWGSLAARGGVLATVEKVVPDDVLRRYNALPILPARAVRSVSVAPLGSHPYGLFDSGLAEVEGYGEDEVFFADFRAASRTAESLSEWTAAWMLGIASHDDFLARLGPARLAALRAPQGPVGEARRDDPISALERMTLVASRVIRDRVLDDGFDVVLSGIGNAHLAAWTALAPLRASGVEAQLAAELGMTGFEPAPGDPYLFARRNMPSAVSLTDVVTVLGRDIGGPGSHSLGVLGAGEVDAMGNLNSTWSATGDYILGSGGANDVATGADEIVVVIPHSRDRLVTSVPYVTAPGRAVKTIVTTEAVLQRRDDEFQAVRYLGGGEPQDAAERIRAGAQWNLKIAPDFGAEPPSCPEDLARLRGFDPQGVFAGQR